MDNAQAPPEPPTITAHVTVTGEAAELLRDLAAVAGRSPEELALEYATGKLVLPTTDQPVEWAVFEGPTDLSERSEELLQQGMGQ
ncbi:hypothetical protein [Streptacidiphilus fuscans]|uniref:Uncharacterized protein n=1 Tax=Streptacidiphilus fuscans TaxID=2789292 RepID=A0A931B600_9ACTN|nr:hypothetical protein [Streptacidiphilus fuscans]MBF9069631.1 hypothetical protein [Streptacidiphilus fuscans]